MSAGDGAALLGIKREEGVSLCSWVERSLAFDMDGVPSVRYSTMPSVPQRFRHRVSGGMVTDTDIKCTKPPSRDLPK